MSMTGAAAGVGATTGAAGATSGTGIETGAETASLDRTETLLPKSSFCEDLTDRKNAF